MTMESLRAALDDLEVHAGVPHDARLKVSHYQQGGWEIVATWTPEPKPADPVPVPPVGVVIGPPSVQLSGSFLDQSPEEIAARIQRDTRGVRRIKDNPQA